MEILSPTIPAALATLAALSSRGRPMKFTPERIDQIRNLVERGHSREEIAEIVGCTVGSLQVTCSRLGLSLRRPRFPNGVIVKWKPKTTSAPDKPVKPNDLPPASPSEPTPAPQIDDLAPARLTLQISYRDRQRTVILPLTDKQIGTLALEAEIRGMHIGELISAILLGTIDRDAFDIITNHKK